MKFGFASPILDSARVVSQLAREAEQAGWDGFFLGEAVWHIDVWVCLTAAAMTTERIKLGTMITPLPRMRPWKLAAETATLDNLSGGRVILSLGMGIWYYGYQSFLDETTDKRERAELMDEGLDILTQLYQGEPFKHEGQHYHIDLTQTHPQYYPPKPVQQPRIPIWMVGVWPKMKSMRRVLRCDGLIPEKQPAEGQPSEITPQEMAEMKAYVDANRALPTSFDMVMQGPTLMGMSAAQAQDYLCPYEEAGANWWMDAPYDKEREDILKYLRQGPPKIG